METRIQPRVGLAVAVCAVAGVFMGGLLGDIATVAPEPIWALVIGGILVAGAAAAIVLLIRYRIYGGIVVTPDEIQVLDSSGRIASSRASVSITDIVLYKGSMEWKGRGGSSRVGEALVISTPNPDDFTRVNLWFYNERDARRLASLVAKPFKVVHDLAPTPPPSVVLTAEEAAEANDE